ncbi:Os09g0247500 [Oryza sativa Japonica Group]|uniref:Os09g0247500 protein n=1 Tax=Oryza sativa subsp. japonica TaxID=39947 RepID=Q6K4G3_ORYSJ|nr:unknown protein [Oryza sativa Japonica Group]BAD25993.1 unknown protein [Oryza sativa Japonica Group]BAF24576.1 Os09g0247500 [Oryza sativa Japonica Group]|eukprot:NP_001062662.1 Os09g0247500 [Oryza sativa Japonica Group]
MSMVIVDLVEWPWRRWIWRRTQLARQRLAMGGLVEGTKQCEGWRRPHLLWILL